MLPAPTEEEKTVATRERLFSEKRPETVRSKGPTAWTVQIR